MTSTASTAVIIFDDGKTISEWMGFEGFKAEAEEKGYNIVVVGGGEVSGFGSCGTGIAEVIEEISMAMAIPIEEVASMFNQAMDTSNTETAPLITKEQLIMPFMYHEMEPIKAGDCPWLCENDEERMIIKKLSKHALAITRHPQNFSNKNTKQPYRPVPRSRLWKFRVKRPQKSFSY